MENVLLLRGIRFHTLRALALRFRLGALLGHLPSDLHARELRLSLGLRLFRSEFLLFVLLAALAPRAARALASGLLFFDHLGLQCFHAEADLTLFAVHVDDLGLNLVAFLDHVTGILYIASGELADMDHAGTLGPDVDEGAV